MSDRVTISIEAGVADVRLNRPDKLNAVDGAMFRALVDAGESLKADPSVRAIVLSGEGRGFCAGLDLGSFQAMADQGPANPVVAARAVVQASTSIRCSIAAGPHHLARTGGGLHLDHPACPGDRSGPRQCTGRGPPARPRRRHALHRPRCPMSVLEIRWGLVPDMTGTQMLPRLVGLDVAKELTFTGRMVTGRRPCGSGWPPG
jgi:enoyl-CoA hydratase/carnithine racemase